MTGSRSSTSRRRRCCSRCGRGGQGREAACGPALTAAPPQAFMDFQMQRMTSAFIDHFGFNDEEFGEQEESVK